MTYLSTYFFIFLLLTISVSNGGCDKPSIRIVGGEPTTIEDYPYQVSVCCQGYHFCGGSIIKENYILTAAHCTDNCPEELSVRAGSTERDESGQYLGVETVINHPNYSDEDEIYDFDISILKLEENLIFGPGVQPIQLPDQSEGNMEDGIMGVATGWGRMSFNGPTSVELQMVELPTYNYSDCNPIYKNRLTNRMFCAGYQDGGKDTCEGDSGGPFNVDGVLVGITSFGENCGLYPGVYTKVSWFIDFINDTIKNL